MQRTHVLILVACLGQISNGTIFGIRIVDAPNNGGGSYGAPPKPSYGSQGGGGNILQGVQNIKAGALRAGAGGLRLKVGPVFLPVRHLWHQGDIFYGGANALDQTANGLSPASTPQRLRRPSFQQFQQSQQSQQSQQVEIILGTYYDSICFSLTLVTSETLSMGC